MRATIELPVRLDSVADDAASAVAACGRKDVNSALETVERVRASVARTHLEGLVIRVAAEFAGSHDVYPLFEIHWVLPASGKTKRRIW
jgi:hypothetical protein